MRGPLHKAAKDQTQTKASLVLTFERSSEKCKIRFVKDVNVRRTRNLRLLLTERKLSLSLVMAIMVII